MALVSQEPVLFARSVRRNILYGLEADDGVATTPGEVRGAACVCKGWHAAVAACCMADDGHGNTGCF